MSDPELTSAHETPGNAVAEMTALYCVRRAVNEDDRLRPGDMLGGLIVVRFLAAGGMGDVYEAEQGGGLNRRVILKVLQGIGSEEARARFRASWLYHHFVSLKESTFAPTLATGTTSLVS